MAYGIPVAASDIAGEAARSVAPQYEPAARTAGALLGGVGAAATQAPSGAARVIRSATSALSPEDLAAMQAVRMTAQNIGAPVTIPEAAAYAAPGRADGLLPVQRAVEQSSRGGPIVAPMMVARPAAQQAAVGQVVGQIAPQAMSPSQLGPAAQAAAQGSLDAERMAINARADPLYAASEGDLIDPAAYSVLDQHPVYQASLAAVRSDPERAHLIAGLPDNSVGVVDATAKRLATLSTQAAGTPLAPGDLHLAAIRDQTAQLAHSVADASSPTYAAARQMVAQGRAATLDPMTAGPLGQVAKAATVPQQRSALFPTAPVPGQAAETMAAIRAMSAQDPSVAPSLLAAHVGQTAAESMQAGPTGPAMNGGGRFVATIQGNPQQAATLQAGMAAAAPQAVGPYSDLVDALSAAGKRLPTRPPSPDELAALLTSPKVDGAEGSVAPLVGMEAFHSPVGALAATGGRLVGAAVNAVNRARVNANARQLGEMITAPADQTAAVIQGARDAGARQREALAQMLLQGVGVATPRQPGP